MSLVRIDTNPSRKDLLWFGALFAVFCGIAGCVLAWQFPASAAPRVVWAAGVVVPLVYYAIPAVRRPIYLAWIHAAWPLGWIISHVVVLVAYYLVVTPIGLVMRLVGRDPLRLRFDRAASTYWTPHGESGGPFRQY